MAGAEDATQDIVLGEDMNEDPLGWVAPSPRETASQITPSALGVFTIVEERAEAAPINWRAWSPVEGKRVCSEFSEGGFAMYEFVFRELGLRLPFSELAMGVFDRLKLAPSQFHPNAMAFLRAFELVCEHLLINPTVNLFLRIFKLQRQRVGARQGWVSFKQQVKLFEMYTDSIRGFKERYYVIKPMTDAAHESLYHMVEETTNGVTVSRRRPRFPLAWTSEHFVKSSESYLIKDEELTQDEVAALELLKGFVARFRPGRCVARDGSSVLGDDGEPLYETRYINTRGVLKAPTRAARKELLGNRICFILSVFTLFFFWDFVIYYVFNLVVCLLSDNMADFAKDFLKHAVVDGKKKKKVVRSTLSAVVSNSGTGVASSGSPAAKVTSPLGPSSARLKRQRGPEEVVDLDAEQGFALPHCYENPNFLNDFPLQVTENEKKIIRNKPAKQLGDDLARDAAGLIRILETALTLHEDASKPSAEVQQLRSEKALLETRVLGLENRVQDLLGKQENFVKVSAELNEKNLELRRLYAEMETLKLVAGEADRLKEEVAGLKAAMVSAEDEGDATRGLLTRADLVGEIQSLGGKLLGGAKFAFANAVEQIKALNGGVELNTEGIGFWRKVMDGQVILPEEHKVMEEQDLDDDDEEEEEDEQKDDEEGEGESR
jgi:hypothetical protein